MPGALDDLIEAIWHSELTGFLTFFLPSLTAFLAGCVACRLIRDRQHARERSEQGRAMAAELAQRARAYDALTADVSAALLRVRRAVRERDAARAATSEVTLTLRRKVAAERAASAAALEELRAEFERAQGAASRELEERAAALERALAEAERGRRARETELEELRRELATARENERRHEQRTRELMATHEAFVARAQALESRREAETRDRSLRQVKALMADLGSMVSALEGELTKES